MKDSGRRRPGEGRTAGGDAVVLGAGMAGLAAAAALARRAPKVTVVERDPLPRADEARKGVPQGRHVHLLLPGGAAALERLLPGIEGELARAGAHVLREPGDFSINVGGGRLDLSLPNPDLVLIGATRPLIEGVVRERVRSLPNVRLIGGTAARGLVAGSGGAVTGVQVQRSDGAAPETIPADLVVDATGRGSRAPRWLEALGYEAPGEEVVRVDVRYVTRLFHRPPRSPGARNVLVAALPDERRGGVGLAVEGNRWIVTLTGRSGEQPPVELEAFRAYAGSLWCRDLYAIAANEEPVGDAVTGSYPANARRRYDRLRRFPGGFVVLGDALSPFNPTYAQGMSMAAVEAEVLGDAVERAGTDGVARAFYRSIAGRLDDAWTQAVDNDLRHPAVDGPRTLRWRVVDRYAQRLLPVAHTDPVVGRAFFDVMSMLAPGSSLLRPAVAARVLTRGVRHPGAHVGNSVA